MAKAIRNPLIMITTFKRTHGTTYTHSITDIIIVIINSWRRCKINAVTKNDARSRSCPDTNYTVMIVEFPPRRLYGYSSFSLVTTFFAAWRSFCSLLAVAHHPLHVNIRYNSINHYSKRTNPLNATEATPR